MLLGRFLNKGENGSDGSAQEPAIREGLAGSRTDRSKAGSLSASELVILYFF